jgi:hypothetical protein
MIHLRVVAVGLMILAAVVSNEAQAQFYKGKRSP